MPEHVVRRCVVWCSLVRAREFLSPYRARHCLRDPKFSRFDTTPACDGHTDVHRHTTHTQDHIAYTALAQCRAVTKSPFIERDLLVSIACCVYRT